MKDKIIIYGSLVLIFLVSVVFIFNSKDEQLQIQNIRRTINVDIKGAVINPGVKVMEAGSTVEDLINKSGGLLDSADTSTINLSKRLDDEMVVIVYTKDEIEEMTTGSTSVKVIEKECFCPVIENNACIDKDDFTEIENTSKISLNNASKEELMTLSGIGSAKADAIIEYRTNNPFKTIEEIMNVKGIGQAIFEKIKDYITI